MVVESGQSSSLIHYDHLVLCTGTQYQVPSSLGGHTKPTNIFTVNNDREAIHLLQWVKANFLGDPKGEISAVSVESMHVNKL